MSAKKGQGMQGKSVMWKNVSFENINKTNSQINLKRVGDNFEYEISDRQMIKSENNSPLLLKDDANLDKELEEKLDLERENEEYGQGIFKFIIF